MNTYEKIFRENKTKYADRVGQVLTTDELYKMFGSFKAKDLESVEQIVTDKPIAYIILAPSGCGKSTYCKKFIEEHENTKWLSVDDVTLAEVQKQGLIGFLDDEIAISKMGDALEECAKNKTNVILDGLYIDVPTRMSLLETLRELGYEICIITHKNRSEFHTKCLISRAVDYTLEELYQGMVSEDEFRKKKSNNVSPTELADEYCRMIGKTREELFEEIKTKADFVYKVNYCGMNYKNEMEGHAVMYQIDEGVYKFGAHYYVEV